MDSETLLIIVITAAVCAVIAAGAWFFVSKARSRRLRQRFGPEEYDRAVDHFQDRQLAEATLENRKERVETYAITPLSAPDQANYRQSWAELQRRFVDDPHQAVEEGDKLILEVMQKRGYPVNGFEQAAADLSVNYPAVVTHYRAAAAIAARNRTGKAGTEELRQAVVHFRALFHELLESPPLTSTRMGAPAAARSDNRFKFPRLQNIRRRGGVRS